ncbi:MAG: baseplate J/gp47 family protein [candidate division Zixibacteria bacterium]|nr:baseplate J/gp47 family protein [candidate division Zixibacteria bacterium]
MALNIPTTEEIKDRNLANIEANLNQDTPPNDIAFNKVLAGVEAINHTELYKFGVERTKQNLALTAYGVDLENIGIEYETPINPAVATNLSVDFVATNGTPFPAGTTFIGEANGIRYFSDSLVIAGAGIATPTMTAEIAGAVGNLDVGAPVTMSVQIPGAASTGEVTIVNTTGADKEEQEAYRERVLFAIRSSPGGGNATNYKIWAEGVSGVETAYPYSGRNFGTPSATFPGDRTIFIESTTDIQVDGIPPQSLLDDVREALNFEPETERSRPPLGLEDTPMDVLAITRSIVNVTVTGLTIDASLLAQAQSDISTGLDFYLRDIRPFVEGIDLISERNDTITTLTIGNVVQSVLDGFGGSAETVSFNREDTGDIELYTLEPGELAKLGTVSYV